MSRFNPLQNAFVAGELTPRLEGRDDIRQYGQGLRQSVNQIVLPQGAAMHRSGTQFESETKGSGPVILRPFEVGLDQAYILEMGNEYMRFHANEGQLAIATVLPAVNFDGASYLSGNAGVFSSTNSFLFSLWFQMQGDDGILQHIAEPIFPVKIRRNASDKLSFVVIDGAATTHEVTSTDDFSTVQNPGWHHVIWSVDTDLSRFQVYVDDAAASLSGAFSGVSNPMLSGGGAVFGGIGTLTSPASNLFNGDMADVYFNYGTSLDLDNIANRRKFIDGAGKPVGLGLQGDNPTGSVPEVYLSGATAAWHTNKGTGSGYTETGALLDASSSPSD